MNNFKRQGGFGGGKKSFGRPSYGGDRGYKGGAGKGFGRPLEMFQATCAACGRSCEVPFRPNGKKPVYCKECFAENGGPASEPRNDRYAEKKPFAPSAPTLRPEPHREIGEMKRQIETLGRKLDKVIALLGDKVPAEKEVKAEEAERPVFPVASNMPPERDDKPVSKKAAKKKK